MNQLILIGRIKEIPEIKETSNGLSYCNLLLEVEKQYQTDEEKKEYELYNVTVWRNMVEEILKFATLNRLVAVKGRLRANNFTKDDGTINYRCEITAEKVVFLTE